MFVQFSDSNETEIISVFGCIQDPAIHLNLGEVGEDDLRYITYMARFAPQVPIIPTITELIAAERYMREGVGITINGSVIDTSRDGQALIASAAVSAILDATYTCNWKTGSGFIELDASELITIAKAVRAHVQACFDREMVLLQAIDSDLYRDDMLNEGWPDSLPQVITPSQ